MHHCLFLSFAAASFTQQMSAVTASLDAPAAAATGYCTVHRLEIEVVEAAHLPSARRGHDVKPDPIVTLQYPEHDTVITHRTKIAAGTRDPVFSKKFVVESRKTATTTVVVKVFDREVHAGCLIGEATLTLGGASTAVGCKWIALTQPAKPVAVAGLAPSAAGAAALFPSPARRGGAPGPQIRLIWECSSAAGVVESAAPQYLASDSNTQIAAQLRLVSVPLPDDDVETAMVAGDGRHHTATGVSVGGVTSPSKQHAMTEASEIEQRSLVVATRLATMEDQMQVFMADTNRRVAAVEKGLELLNDADLERQHVRRTFGGADGGASPTAAREAVQKRLRVLQGETESAATGLAANLAITSAGRLAQMQATGVSALDSICAAPTTLSAESERVLAANSFPAVVVPGHSAVREAAVATEAAAIEAAREAASTEPKRGIAAARRTSRAAAL
jgi:hypothetical protein